MEQDKDKEKIKRLEESQAQLIKDLLNEAIEHKSDSIGMLEQVAKDRSIDLSSKSKKVAKEKVKIEIKTDDLDLDDYENEDSYDDNEYEDEDDLNYLIDDSDIPFDLVPLPSKGLVYKGIKGKLPVAYLTASDEDLITSPNLYIDGKIIDILLRKKIIDKNIKPENLCKGDRDAISIWLRATGYGSNFPVSVKDPLSGERFDYGVDLSKLQFKEFNLKSDNDGYFDFKLPRTEHVVKFKFLSYKEEAGYLKYLEKTNQSFKRKSIATNIATLKAIFENEKDIETKMKSKLDKILEYLDEYIDTIDTNKGNLYLKNVTYLLEKSIISIDGKSDSSFIKKYVNNMPAFDSMALRKHINENTPGIDFKITVERPESLGGGSFETFLELDSTIFLNIT